MVTQPVGLYRAHTGGNIFNMLKQRIYVSVVGFSDVERHALNTVFRLSEEREVSYVPWVPLVGTGSSPATGSTDVMLVDGESAEAVLSHAKDVPHGQRLIWVGPGAPGHAWRVLARPISWSSMLHDLDAVYAARQADSGYLDLDISGPAPLEDDKTAALHAVRRRALLVGLDPDDRDTLLKQLAAVGIDDVDEATSSGQAADWIERQAYQCGAFNLDSEQFDVWTLSHMFARRNPKAVNMGISVHASPLAAWWSRRRVRKDTQRAGVNALLARPLNSAELLLCVERVR